MGCVEFTHNNNNYQGRTQKGSVILVKEYPLGWDWVIYDSSRELPAMSTQQQHAYAVEHMMKGQFRTSEEAIENFISTTNTLFDLDLTWRITND